MRKAPEHGRLGSSYCNRLEISGALQLRLRIGRVHEAEMTVTGMDDDVVVGSS
jgi:hypothetical protein